MRRYQIFISSTFTDLKDERSAVLQSILKLDCFPAGMELFPSASVSQFEYIKRIILESDYYILIIGGRYGDELNGISYTEQEFDFAVENNVPVLAFLHSAPEDIPAKFYELSEEKREKLKKFRSEIEDGRLVSYWNTTDNLASAVYRSLENEIKINPRKGWERALDTGALRNRN